MPSSPPPPISLFLLGNQALFNRRSFVKPRVLQALEKQDQQSDKEDEGDDEEEGNESNEGNNPQARQVLNCVTRKQCVEVELR